MPSTALGDRSHNLHDLRGDRMRHLHILSQDVPQAVQEGREGRQGRPGPEGHAFAGQLVQRQSAAGRGAAHGQHGGEHGGGGWQS